MYGSLDTVSLVEPLFLTFWWLSSMKIVSADLNKALGNTMDAHEAAQMHQNFSQQLLQDHIAACSLPEHNLISVCETTSHKSHSFHCIYLHICYFLFWLLVRFTCSYRCALVILRFCLSRFQWTDGPPPVQIQAQNGPTTSLASLLWENTCPR